MNPSHKHPFKSLTGAIALSLFVGSAVSAQALTWNGGTGTWDNVTANWSGASVWVAGGLAEFPNTGAAIVTIGDNLDIGTLSFSTVNSGPYTFNNALGYTIDFTGSGISSATSNVQMINSNGIINFKNSASAGDSSIQISSNGAVNFLDTSSAGSSLITNSGQLTFQSGSTAGSATIDNPGILEFSGTASGGTASISNGGFLDISGNTSGVVTIGSLSNSSGGISGAVILGQNELQIAGNLTLSTVAQNLLDFTLDTPTTSGTISLSPGNTFFGANTGEVDINLSSIGLVTAGTYTLIDWTGSTATGVDLSDFALVGPLPAGISGATLVINGSQLQLVAVPEPATMAMPLVAALGMLWLRRRTARATA